MDDLKRRGLEIFVYNSVGEDLILKEKIHKIVKKQIREIVKNEKRYCEKWEIKTIQNDDAYAKEYYYLLVMNSEMKKYLHYAIASHLEKLEKFRVLDVVSQKLIKQEIFDVWNEVTQLASVRRFFDNSNNDCDEEDVAIGQIEIDKLEVINIVNEI